MTSGKRVLVRRPSPHLALGLITHIKRTTPNIELAHKQWESYVDAFESAGWQSIEVPAAPELPDSVFIEDTMVVRRDRAIIAAPGAQQRRGEIPAAQASIAALGYEIGYVHSPATLDGGDVLKIGERMYVGVGGRTTTSACGQLAEFFEIEVIPVPITKALHLKSALTALPDGTVIGYPPIVDDPSFFDSYVAVPEEPGSHVVVLDDETVLMAASASQTHELFRARGLKVVTVDISEFEKLEGCVTCLSVRLR